MKYFLVFTILTLVEEVINYAWFIIRPFLSLTYFWFVLKVAGYFMT